MKRKLFEVALVLVIVAIVGFTGWFVFNAKKSTDKLIATGGSGKSQTSAPSPATKKYTDTAKIYTLEYPSSWKVVYASDGGEGPAPDYSKTSRMVTFVPPDAPDNNGANGVVVQADTNGTLAQQITRMSQGEQGSVDHPLRELINGYDAKPLGVTYKGDAESYTDDRYLLDHNSAEVYITFREKYHHDYPAADWDATSQIPAFKAILNSITFLQ